MTTPRRSNGEPVSRAELGAHLERIDASVNLLHKKVDAITEKLLVPQRWFAGRMTVLVDRSLIVVVSAVLAYIATHS
jgi:hypothetical protein